MEPHAGRRPRCARARRTKQSYVPVQPLLGSEVLRAYLETTEGARLLPHVPPSWAGLHRAKAAEPAAIEAEAPPTTAPPAHNRLVDVNDPASVELEQQRQLDALAAHLAATGGGRELLSGWGVEIRTRHDARGQAGVYSVFVDASARKYRSRAEVSRFFGLGEGGEGGGPWSPQPRGGRVAGRGGRRRFFGLGEGKQTDGALAKPRP